MIAIVPALVPPLELAGVVVDVVLVELEVVVGAIVVRGDVVVTGATVVGVVGAGVVGAAVVGVAVVGGVVGVVVCAAIGSPVHTVTATATAAVRGPIMLGGT
jgi:hypothetical protein